MSYTFTDFAREKVRGLPFWIYMLLGILPGIFYLGSSNVKFRISSILFLIGFSIGYYYFYMLKKDKKLYQGKNIGKIHFIFSLILIPLILLGFYMNYF